MWIASVADVMITSRSCDTIEPGDKSWDKIDRYKLGTRTGPYKDLDWQFRGSPQVSEDVELPSSHVFTARENKVHVLVVTHNVDSAKCTYSLGEYMAFP
jgi:hypothetical protein